MIEFFLIFIEIYYHLSRHYIETEVVFLGLICLYDLLFPPSGRQSESGGNILDTSDDSPVLRGSVPPAASAEPKREFRPKPSAVAENTADSQQQRQRSRSPSLTPENMNQINHLKGQFRFVDDAQRLFRPLLEAIGVNIKVCGCSF